GDAVFLQGTDVLDDRLRATRAAEKIRVRAEDARRLGGRLPDQLHAEAAHAQPEQRPKAGGGALRPGVEDGVAAADVDDDGMGDAEAVAELEEVLLAGPAAVAEIAGVRAGVRS